MQRKIASISTWMTSNFLSLNPCKTEFLLIGVPQQCAKVNQLVLHVPDNTTVTPVSNARNLGILFDSNLSFKQHINFLTKTCLYHCRDLGRFKSSLDFGTACIIATALVHAKLDYCNSLYCRLSSSQINQLQVIQNSLARAVTKSKTPRFCHISPFFSHSTGLK